MSTPIDNSDHFARQCSPKYYDTDEQGNEWLKGEAFRPTEDNPNISGQWVEHHQGSWQTQLNETRKELADSERKVRRSHRFGILQVTIISEIGAKYGRTLSVFHTPSAELRLLSHSEIVGVRPADKIVQQKLADAADIENAFVGMGSD